jgi:predicted dehydrogenase
MDDVRVGIIGIGGMGSHHLNYLSAGEVPNARLTAVCDVNPERLAWAREKLGESVKTYATAEALIADKTCDAVLIATPHYFHPPIAIAAFRAGLHVMSEKPAGVYTRQVREMNEAAAASGKKFGLMFNQRTSPMFQKIKDIVASGELGELRRSVYVITTWFRTQAYYDSGDWRATWAGEGGGVLINQCPHNLDIWQWIVGQPRRVRAFCHNGKHHRIEVEDDVTAYVEYDNGATGVFVTTTGEAPGTNIFELSGDRGHLSFTGGKLTFQRTRVPVSEFLNTSKASFARPETWTCDIPVAKDSDGNSHRTITRAWIQAIVKDTPLVAEGKEGIRSLEISNAMYLSAWTGETVTLPVDEDRFYTLLQERIATSTYVKKATGKSADVAGSFNLS